MLSICIIMGLGCPN